MANMVDYLAWRGDLHLETSPWNEIDGLLIATISYLDFNGGRDPNGWMLEEMARIDLIRPGTSSAFPGRKTAFEKMAACERFHSSRLHHGGTLCRFACSFIYSLPVYPGPAVYRGLHGSWSHNQEQLGALLLLLRVLEEWETDTQEATMQRGKQAPGDRD